MATYTVFLDKFSCTRAIRRKKPKKRPSGPTRLKEDESRSDDITLLDGVGSQKTCCCLAFPSWHLDLFASDLTRFVLNDFDLYIFFSSGPPIRSVGKQLKYETVQFERYNNSKGVDDLNDYYK